MQVQALHNPRVGIIHQFNKIRADGTVVGVDEVDLTKPTSRVVGVRWRFAGKSIQLDFPGGATSQPIAAETAVAVIDNGTSIKVFNPDGTPRFEIENVQMIRGEARNGRFAWIEIPGVAIETDFAVVFEYFDRATFVQYQLTFDAHTGELLGSSYTR